MCAKRIFYSNTFREKTAYKITTPLATIGVRGIVLDLPAQRGNAIVMALDHGGIGLRINYRT